VIGGPEPRAPNGDTGRGGALYCPRCSSRPQSLISSWPERDACSPYYLPGTRLTWMRSNHHPYGIQGAAMGHALNPDDAAARARI